METQKPDLRLWSKADYPDGTVGNMVFPPQLDQRVRLADVLYREARLCVVGVSSEARWAESSFKTVKDLMQASCQELGVFLYRNNHYQVRTSENLVNLLGSVIRSPHDRLMGAIFGISDLDELLIHPDNEDQRAQAIQEAIDPMEEDLREVLDYRFGLTSWQPLDLKKIGEVVGKTRERIRQLESKALRYLRHPFRTRVLKQYLPQ